MIRFFVGLLLGALAAFPLGINVGRGAPLLSNPFAATRASVQQKVREDARALLHATKQAIHQATAPSHGKDVSPHP